MWLEVLDARIAAARAELAKLETERAYHRGLPLDGVST